MDLFWRRKQKYFNMKGAKIASNWKMIILIFKFYNYLDREKYSNYKNRKVRRNEKKILRVN